MDTGLLELTRRVTEITRDMDAKLERSFGPRCVIPGCKYTAPLGKYCGLHAGRELATRKAQADWGRKF